MHRRSMRGALVVVAAATLTVAACGSKEATTTSAGESSSPAAAVSSTPAAESSSGGAAESSGGAESSAPAASASESGAAATSDAPTSGGAAGGLSIQPEVNINPEGDPVEAAAGAGEVANPAGDGSAKCEGVTLAMVGALTGPNAALGINILNGAKVALDEHNKANPDCQVTLKDFDTEGDPQKAGQVAPTIVGDASVIGMLGPAFSGETLATGDIFFQGGLLTLTASATNPTISEQGWTTFFRGLGNDNSQGGAIANYLVKTKGVKKVCVVQDNTDYGIGLATVVKETLGDVADASCAGDVKANDKDFSATVNLIKGAAPDAVYYAGYYAEAAPFVSQLRQAGVTATFVSGDGTNDPQFVTQAGDAAKDAILTCPCGPAPAEFAAKYEALNGQAPGVYSTDAYDLMTIMLKAVDSGVTDRAKMVEFVKGYSGRGLAKEYKWDDKGELAVANPWVYVVK